MKVRVTLDPSQKNIMQKLIKSCPLEFGNFQECLLKIIDLGILARCCCKEEEFEALVDKHPAFDENSYPEGFPPWYNV